LALAHGFLQAAEFRAQQWNLPFPPEFALSVFPRNYAESDKSTVRAIYSKLLGFRTTNAIKEIPKSQQMSQPVLPTHVQISSQYQISQVQQMSGTGLST